MGGWGGKDHNHFLGKNECEEEVVRAWGGCLDNTQTKKRPKSVRLRIALHTLLLVGTFFLWGFGYVCEWVGGWLSPVCGCAVFGGFGFGWVGSSMHKDLYQGRLGSILLLPLRPPCLSFSFPRVVARPLAARPRSCGLAGGGERAEARIV